jgi:gliding motility-associated-like protein
LGIFQKVKNPTLTRFATILLWAGVALANISYAQRGKIITPSTTSVLDPNGDGFVSTSTSGFSNDGYNVDEFEIPMFGLPKSAEGEALNDIQAGANCGTTELTYDNRGFSVYGVLKNGFLIFRFRVAKNQPSVEAYSILIDTDGLVGPDDPNSMPENPGFEIDITMIKNQTKGIYVYNIDGIESCPTEVLRYNLNSNFQIAIADEVSCSDPDYFYDFYVPFADLASQFTISQNTELRIVALTNVSATCAMGGKISDIGGLDDTPYAGCNSCAFMELATKQCPTAITNLCPTCSGFRQGFTPRPTINIPLKAGESDITGGSIAGAEIYISVFGITKALKERDTVLTTSTGAWTKVLATPLAIGDSITAQAKAIGQCNSGGASSGTSFTIVIQNAPPVVSASSSSANYLENGSPLIITPALTIADDDDTELDGATITMGSFFSSEDVLSITTSGGIISTFDPATGILTLTGEASLLQYQNVIRTLTYFNSSDNPTTTTRAIEILVNDGLDDSNVYSVAITIQSVNDPPVVSASVTVFAYANLMVVNNGISITDADHLMLTNATVTISNNFLSTEDALVYVDQNGITAAYNAATGTLALTGIASLANYATALSSIRYSNSNVTPSLLTRRISFVVSDGSNNSNTFFSFIDFPGVNNPPVIVDEDSNAINDVSYSTNEDTELIECVNAIDPDGDPVVITSFTNVSPGGTFTVTTDLCFSFVPTADFNGTVTATITVCDQTAGTLCDAASITITVLPINDAPVITETTTTVQENTSTEICVTYTDVEGDPAVVSEVESTGSSGTVTDTNTGDACFTYTPDPGFIGKDTITVNVCDPADPLVCTSGEIIIDVLDDPAIPPIEPEEPVDPVIPPADPTDPDLPPVIIPGTNQPPGILIDGIPGNTLRVQIPEDSTRVFCFEAIDAEGDEVLLSTITKLSDTGGNIALYQNIEFCFLYTPLENFNGTVSWDVTVCDDDNPSLCSIVRLIVDVLPVNDPPVALPDTLIVSRNVEGMINVLNNDSDVDGDQLQVELVPIEEPTHGVYTLSADGNLQYLSDRYFRGADVLRYSVCDIGDPKLCTEGVLVIEITDLPLKAFEAFSPNGDGLNDYWRIEGVDFFPDNVVQVFDRFNNLVFKLEGYNNENKTWVGESNHGLIAGKLPEGIYYYAINLGAGEAMLKGFVVLKRE